jgi:hypothetical protein
VAGQLHGAVNPTVTGLQGSTARHPSLPANSGGSFLSVPVARENQMLVGSQKGGPGRCPRKTGGILGTVLVLRVFGRPFRMLL